MKNGSYKPIAVCHLIFKTIIENRISKNWLTASFQELDSL